MGANVLEDDVGMHQIEAASGGKGRDHLGDVNQTDLVEDIMCPAIVLGVCQHCWRHIDTNHVISTVGKWDYQPSNTTTKIENMRGLEVWLQFDSHCCIHVLHMLLTRLEEFGKGSVVNIVSEEFWIRDDSEEWVVLSPAVPIPDGQHHKNMVHPVKRAEKKERIMQGRYLLHSGRHCR